MDDASNDRALVVLLGILADSNTWIGRRIEAAGVLLSYEAPPEVVDTAKQFLFGVAEDERPESVALRLKALKLLRQAEARRIRRRATRTHNAKEAQFRPEVARFLRQRRLEEAGLWPAPEGWDADLQVVASERPASPHHGLAEVLRRSRLATPRPRMVPDGRDGAA
jgi:hypothetical protein